MTNYVKSVRIEMDYAGVGELLRSSGVQNDLNDRARQVADAAGSRGVTVEGENGPEAVPITTVEAGSSKRARALVVTDHPAGLAIESKYRLLVGSIEAAK